MSEAENLAVLEDLRDMALVDGLTDLEREAIQRLSQEVLGVRSLLRAGPLACIVLSAVAFVVSLVAVFT